MTCKNREIVASILKQSDSWTVLSHIKPDGDTLGSASALVQMGLSMGKDVKWYGQDPFPERYLFLPLSHLYIPSSCLPSERQNSLVIALDISSLDRGVAGMELVKDLVVIDHHGDNPLFGKANWVDGEISSVGEMIFDISSDLGVAMDLPTAEAIYTAIITDTGNLSFPNVKSKTVRTVADLIDAGVSPNRVAEKLYNRDTTNRLRLWGRAFDRAKWEGGICYSYITKEDFSLTDTDLDDTESLINSFMRVKDTEVALLFVENSEDIKVSLRSKGNISVQKIAHRWGGGGHLCASGCRLKGSVDEVISNVLQSALSS